MHGRRRSSDAADTYFDQAVDHHRVRRSSDRAFNRHHRLRHEPVTSGESIHFDSKDDIDSLDHLDPLYSDDDYYRSHRPLKSEQISSEYPYKPHHFGRGGSRFEPHHYIDYELSGSNKPKKSADSKRKKPKGAKLGRGTAEMLVQESSEKAPKQLNIHNQQLMEKYMSKGSVLFRGLSEEEEEQSSHVKRK